MTKGWVRFHRTQWDDWVSAASRRNPYHMGYAWTYLYAMANHKDGSSNHEDSIVPVKRGQILTSIKKLAAWWGWGRKKVSNFLDRLQRDGKIDQKRTSHYTLITIMNYERYQARHENNDNAGAPEEHPGNTNKNEKNGEGDSFLEA